MKKAEIYPGNWDAEDDDNLEYLLDYYETLCAFLDQAKEENNGAVVYLT